MRTLSLAASILIIVVFTAIFLNAFIEQETAYNESVLSDSKEENEKNIELFINSL